MRPSARLVLGALTSAAQATPSVDGGNVYETYGASCHGKTGKGDGPSARSQPRKVADLTRLAPADRRFDARRIESLIKDHVMSPNMRRRGEVFLSTYSAAGLSDQALRDVTAHSRKLQATTESR